MKLKFIFSFMLLILPAYIFALPLSDITGKVLDGKSNQPIAGAIVSVPQLRINTITDVNGQYTLHSLPPKGKFVIEVRFIGYRSIVRTVDLTAQSSFDFALQPSITETNEVVITGTAVTANSRYNSTSATVVQKEQLLNASTNLIDALARSVPGVSQISTGPAISKPVIRGLSYNRVVTLTDGVKQQGQQWGDEHGIEIDQYQADRVEVLRGAASLLYGSDAIGGVINILEPATPTSGQIKGELLSNYATNNGLTGTSAMLTGNENGFVWRARGSYQNAYSFKTPDGYFPNSGYNNTNFSGMLGLNKQWGYSHLNFSYYKNNIGFYDPESADELYTTEKSRTLDFPRQDIRHYKIALNNNFVIGEGSLKLDLGYQKNQRRELEDGTDPSLFFDLNTYSLDAKYYLPTSNGWEPVIGLSGAWSHSVNKATEEYLIPNYDSYSTGVFGFLKKTVNKDTYSAGLRYDYIYNVGKQLFIEEEEQFSGFKNTFNSLSGALGYTHVFNENLNFKANAGAAFRAPNPAELGSNGVHEGTYRYEVGNPDLKAERSYQADATLEFGANILTGSLGIYENYIHNYIYASNRNGETTDVTEEDGSANTYPIYRYGQVNANLYGAEANITLHPVTFIHFENTFNYTHAQNRSFDRALPFIPAGTLHNTLRFEPKVKGLNSLYVYAGLDNFFKQGRVDETFETPTDSYTLINAGAGTTFKIGKKQQLKVYIAATNLTNKRYYSALSRLKPGRLDQTNPTLGIYDLGRNISFGFLLPLNIK
ncbi:TonB-dependent receptor [Mucilaginibacter sp. Bleaf8]|uniref:TonB-dependent receptor n=1 Tax=Mucilaginibacter sp. Bleaf8 TaxID=2834430 RepID=UPI001BD0F28F|nr:TonB-dependent receptor [Mucilaginibacter sp. Bleaf8]MBS7565262.1 TonB-dependent receptor [Mucilaginibacter sp. Bleaf8]